MILVTGSSGLLGRALIRSLGADGIATRHCDVADRTGDVTDGDALRRLAAGCEGIVHFAAVSRVVWGERDPDACRATNVEGTRHVVAAARATGAWIVFASSREVYGEPALLPVAEDAPLKPLNVYARTKVAGERLVRESGQDIAVLRFSSVYGDPIDHHDRVVPAFARTAVEGGELRVDGAQNAFDFVHVDDAVRGIRTAIDRLPLPPIHLVSGVATTLMELAELALQQSGRGTIRLAEPRPYDVQRFVGDPTRAHKLLDWQARTSIEEGLRHLMASCSE